MKKLFTRDELSELYDHLNQADASLKHAAAKLDTFLQKVFGQNGLLEQQALLAAKHAGKGRTRIRLAQGLLQREVTPNDGIPVVPRDGGKQ